MADVADVEVGYLDPVYVDQIRNRLGVGIDIGSKTNVASMMAAARKMMANGSLKQILEKGVYKQAPPTSGQALAKQLITVGHLPLIPFFAQVAITDVGAIIGMATGASSVSTTLAVLNIGDRPLELAEEPVAPHGYLASQPAVMADTEKLDPPHRPGGAEGPLRSWISSPVKAGLPADWASVGIWRFDRPTVSVYGVSGALRLHYLDAKVDVLIGGETPFRSGFTPNAKNSFYAQLGAAGAISAQSFFDSKVTGKELGSFVYATLDTAAGTFFLTAGCENQTDDHHLVVAVVEAKQK